jgi:hypothetical protein
MITIDNTNNTHLNIAKHVLSAKQSVDYYKDVNRDHNDKLVKDKITDVRALANVYSLNLSGYQE